MPYTKPALRSVHYPEFVATLPGLEGTTMAITGTTSGTGLVAAGAVARLGARVLLLNRPSPRAEAALARLQEAHPDATFVPVDCDLQSLASVRAAAATVRSMCPEGLDVLCNNAGVMALPDQATADGFDVQMQTNHLSHFLLTHELMETLERAAELRGEARVVNHSSVARMSPGKKLRAEYLERRGGDLGGDSASMFTGGARWVRYNQSKLANCAFTAALHERLHARGSKVKALVAHPGLSATELQVKSTRDGGMGHFMTRMLMRLGQSPEDGAMGILACMCVKDAQSGAFYGPGSGAFAMKGPARPFALEPFYDNPETRALLWTKSCEAVGLATGAS